MQVSPQQYKHYWDKGWVVIEGVFAPELVERAAQRGLELIEPEMAAEKGVYKVDRSPDGKEVLPRKLDTPFLKDTKFFGNLVFNSDMPDLIEQLIGVPPLFHSDQLFFKPPRHGSPKAYHQDNAYFLMHPDDHVLTAWVALDDVDEENGCLRYIDESHKGPILPSKEVPGVPHDLTPDPSLYDIRKESLARVKKGGVVFHHSKALHSSGANRSARWRRGYASHWVSADVTGENEVLATGYFYKPALFAGLKLRSAAVRV